MVVSSSQHPQARRALERTSARGAASWVPFSGKHPRPLRWFALGDPQAPVAKVLDVLAVHGLLGDDGWLAADVGLVSIGDHFDYKSAPDEIEDVGRNGVALLAWLASHSPRQVVLIAGNHDLSRVMELGAETDESFARIRARAAWVAEAEKGSDEHRERVGVFRREFPSFSPPGIASRDYAPFASEQRDLVQQLLLAGRFRLGVAGRTLGGLPVLLTHAGLAARDMASLGVGDASADVLAGALNRALARAVDDVAAAWRRRDRTPLSLAPLHLAGGHGVEGGGLLYHRPSDTSRKGADPAWELRPAAPRRFHPRELPRGLVQACGHCNHEKCLTELATWATDAARSMNPGRLRTLRTSVHDIVYDAGTLAPDSSGATLYLIDGAILTTPPAEYELLALEHVDA